MPKQQPKAISELVNKFYDFDGDPGSQDIPVSAETMPDTGPETALEPERHYQAPLARPEAPQDGGTQFFVYICVGAAPSAIAMLISVMVMPNLPPMAIRLLAALPLAGTAGFIWYGYKQARQGDPERLTQALALALGFTLLASFLPLNLINACK